MSSIAFLTIALAYAVFHDGGVDLIAWNVCLAILALVGLAYWLRYKPAPLAQPIHVWLGWVPLLFPCYVAFQLLPLPVSLVRILSPERARIFESLRNVLAIGHLVPLSIAPATTFAYLFRILGYALTFLLVRDITVKSSGRRSWVPAVPLILIAGAEAGFAFLYSSGSDAQIQGTYGNKNHFAGLLEMVLPLTVVYAVAHFAGRRSHSRLAILKGTAIFSVALIIFLGLVYSMSKMGFVSGLLGLFVVGALALATAKIALWKKLSLIAALPVCLLFVFIFSPPDTLIQAFGGLFSSTGANAEGRWPIWMDTLQLIAAYPLFGCGLGNYETAFLKYQTAIPDRDFTFAHNDYLQVAAELGAIGLVILAALLFPIVMNAFRTATQGSDRNARYLALGCIGGIASIALHSVVDFNMYIPSNAMVLAWLCGISAGLRPRSLAPTRDHAVIGPAYLRNFAIAISCLLVIYAPAWLVFETAFCSSPAAEARFCHFGICNIDAGLATQKPAALLEAARRDAADPQRWSDLGDSMLKSGERDRADYCFRRAVALGPDIPFILVRAADFRFTLNENTQALRLSARALRLDSAYWDRIFTDYEKREIPVHFVLRDGLPDDRRVFQEYFRRLLYQERASDAVQTWACITSRGYADNKLANEYIEFLIRGNNYDAAQETWAHYARGRDKSYPDSNLIFNGDFEADPAGSRFDWAIDPAQGAAKDFDQAVHLSGARSLRIQLDGTQNLSNVGVRQTVFLKPGRYDFTAYLRTNEVSTDEGIRFNVVDPEAPKRLNFTTESVVGTNDWKLVEHSFQVVPGTGLIEVSLFRKPSLKFDNLIRGTVWVDQVRIRPD